MSMEPSRERRARPSRGNSSLFALAVAAGGVEVYQGLKGSFRQMVADDPVDATVAVVLGGSYLFYLAEKDHNPKVRTYVDALVFITTCLSVGYADVFARTGAGKAIASAIMTLGPALSGSFLDPPARTTPATEGGRPPAADGTTAAKLLATQEKLAVTLDEILSELRSRSQP
jgi:hypothetical protein